MQWITTSSDLDALCRDLADAPFLALDTEFMRDTTYWAKLCLIQISAKGHTFVIDPMAKGMELDPFLRLIADPKIVKVFHAARQDIEIFYKLGVIPKPLFDTQIAAMALGFGEQVSYDSLVRQVLNIDLDKSSRFTDWGRRPLSEKQISYAANDVIYLSEIYEKLKNTLIQKGRLDWVTEEMSQMEDENLYDLDPQKAWQRLKPKKLTQKYLAVLARLATWREETAQRKDQPRARVLKDEAIDEIATQLPLNASDLEHLRSLSKGFANSAYGSEILRIIKEAMDHPDLYAPRIERPSASKAANQGSVIELLKVLLKAKSEDSEVAVKLIATVKDLEKIILDDEADVPALKGWRRDLFGEDALRLKRGELALVFRNNQVKICAVP